MVSGRGAIIIAILLATNAGAAEVESFRHLFPLRRTDQIKSYPNPPTITSVRNQAVLTVAGENRFSSYYPYFATRSYGYTRAKMHLRRARWTSISIDQARASKSRSQPSKRPARRPVQTLLQTQPSVPSVPANPLTDLPTPPTSPAGIVDAPPQTASTTNGPESNHDDRGDAFALSPSPELAQRPSPPAELPQQSQQEKTQQTPPAQIGKEESRPPVEMAKPQDTPVFVNGALAVPGAATDSDTVPSKFSDKNAADDRLVTLAYTFKLLGREERSAIYQTLKGQPGGRALKADIGTKLPLGIELRPVPDELIVRVPQTRGYDYMVAGDAVLLVSPLTRAVVGVFLDRD